MGMINFVGVENLNSRTWYWSTIHNFEIMEEILLM